MLRRYANVITCRIDADDVAAQPRDRLGEQSATAPDIGYSQPGKRPRPERVPAEMARDLVTDISDTDRIEPMKRAEAAACVPPFVGQRGEVLDLLRIDRG